jgi:hypothetical protein
LRPRRGHRPIASSAAFARRREKIATEFQSIVIGAQVKLKASHLKVERYFGC